MLYYETWLCTGELRPIFHIEDEFVAAGWSGAGLMRTDQILQPNEKYRKLTPSERERNQRELRRLRMGEPMGGCRL